MLTRSFATLCSALDDKKMSEAKKNTLHHNERSDVAQKKQKGPASLFGREAEVSVGALKTKSCLSVSEFFLFSGNTCRSSPKSADGEFSLFRFFCSGKRNEKPSRLERERSDKAQRRLSKNHSAAKSPLQRMSKKLSLTNPTIPLDEPKKTSRIFLNFSGRVSRSSNT